MATRRFQDKPLILMQSCCANQTVTAKCSRFKDAAYTSDGWFFIETKVAKFIYSDAKGGIIGAFKHILDKQTDYMNGQIMIIIDTMSKPNPKSLKTVVRFFSLAQAYDSLTQAYDDTFNGIENEQLDP